VALAAAARIEGRPRPPAVSDPLPERAAVFLSHTSELREHPAGRSLEHTVVGRYDIADAAGARCWPPDAPSSGPCRIA